MKNKKINARKSKKYLIAFIFVMLLNLGLGAFLLHTTIAQTSEPDYRNQPPLEAEVVTQVDSPLLITIINVDNSNPSYQAIDYSVQNISNKSVRAYVILHKSKTDTIGGATTSRFATKLFQPNTFQNGWLAEERSNIKSDNKLFLSVDYVEFEDGSSWGNDVAQQSEYITGSRAGWKEGVKQSRELFKSQKGVALINLLKQETTEINPSFIDSSQSDKWQRGYLSGYRTAISTLRVTYERLGIDVLSTKLEEMENSVSNKEKNK